MAKPPESAMSIYYRMCGSKRKYRTKEEAECKGTRVYPCPHCKGWHRTTLNARKP